MNSQDLKFLGPYPFAPRTDQTWHWADDADGGGIYLFTAVVQGMHRVFYVGESKNITNRLRYHAEMYLDGKYKIYSPESLANGEPILVWKPRNQAERSLADLASLSAALQGMMPLVNIFYSRIDGDKSLLRHAESAILLALSADPSAKKYLENQRSGTPKPDGGLGIAVSAVEPVFGLPTLI